MDPGGIATARPKNPTSWNRYAYVGADRVNYADPRGAIQIYTGGGTISDCNGLFNSDGTTVSVRESPTANNTAGPIRSKWIIRIRPA